jgi:hypothetical protein
MFEQIFYNGENKNGAIIMSKHRPDRAFGGE